MFLYLLVYYMATTLTLQLVTIYTVAMVILVLQHQLTCVISVHDRVHKTDCVRQIHYHYCLMLTLLFAVEAWEAWVRLVRLLEPFLPINNKYVTLFNNSVKMYLTK